MSNSKSHSDPQKNRKSNAKTISSARRQIDYSKNALCVFSHTDSSSSSPTIKHLHSFYSSSFPPHIHHDPYLCARAKHFDDDSCVWTMKTPFCFTPQNEKPLVFMTNLISGPITTLSSEWWKWGEEQWGCDRWLDSPLHIVINIDRQ